MGCENQPTQETSLKNDLEVIIEDTALGTVFGGGSYAATEQVYLQIILSENVIFDGWMMDGTLISLETDFYFTMPDHDVTLIASAHRIETIEIKRMNMLLPPTTLYYFPGIEFTIEGLVVEVEYVNGDKVIIDNDDLEIIYPQFDLEKAYTVTLNYEGFSTYFLVFYEEIRLVINTLKTLLVVGETVDYYYHVNADLVGNGDDLYQIAVVNPEIAEAIIDPSYPQHAQITGLQAGKTQVVITLVSDPMISQTVDINVVEALPPVESDDWPGEYLGLILDDLSLELTPIIGTTYTYVPSQIYGDYYSFSIENPENSLDFVAYALNMETKGWYINRYLPNYAILTKNNIRMSVSYNNVTNLAWIHIAKQGHDFLSMDIKDDLLQIISGKIHEDVSTFILPDFMFYEYAMSPSSWQHPYSEIIHVFGHSLNDPLFTINAYVDELMNIGFTTFESNDTIWYLDPNETYMIRYWFYETHIQMEIQSIDYYQDTFHFSHDEDIYR